MQRCEALDQSILNMVSNSTTNLGIQSLPADWWLFDLYEQLGDNYKGQSRVLYDQIQEADAIYETDAGYPSHVGMQLAMPSAPVEAPMLALIKKCLKDAQGLPVGVAHGNPMLDSRLYKVEFMYGHNTQLFTNQITENLFATIDGAGNRLF